VSDINEYRDRTKCTEWLLEHATTVLAGLLAGGPDRAEGDVARVAVNHGEALYREIIMRAPGKDAVPVIEQKTGKPETRRFLERVPRSLTTSDQLRSYLRERGKDVGSAACHRGVDAWAIWT
jgi:hypothetical protein